MKSTTKYQLIVVVSILLIIGLVEVTETQRAAHYVILGLALYFGGIGTALGIWYGLKWIVRRRNTRRTRKDDADEYRSNIAKYNNGEY
jgi:hypothetical protein